MLNPRSFFVFVFIIWIVASIVLICEEVKMDALATSINDDLIEIKLGSNDGVKKGMDGTVFIVTTISEETNYLPVGTFSVLEVYDHSSILKFELKVKSAQLSNETIGVKFADKLTIPQKETQTTSVIKKEKNIKKSTSVEKSDSGIKIPDGRDITYYFTEGKKYEDQEGLEQALAYYRKAQEILPEDKMISQKLETLQKRIEERDRTKREEVEAKQKRMENLKMLPYYELAAQESIDQKDWKTAREYISKILDIDPGNKFALELQKALVPEKMILIPSGHFEMGSNDGSSDEKPVHTVYISEFYMDKYEVTNAEYKKCVDMDVCSAPSESKSYSRSSYYNNSNYDNYPVIYVDWHDAKKFCEWKGKRLPTEAEWEYAARGGLSGRKYPNGDSISKDDANYNGSDTTKVGSYSPNGYGLYDMAGNVWEWVNDWYNQDYYSKSPSNNPEGQPSGSYRSLRGGSWRFNSSFLRVAYRFRYIPSFRGIYLGFRCAKDIIE